MAKWRKRTGGRRCRDETKGTAFKRPQAGEGFCCRRPAVHATVALRLPVCSAGDHSASDPLVPAPLFPAPPYRPPSRSGGREAPRKSSRPIRSASFTSTSPRSTQRKAGSACWWPWTAPASSPFAELHERATRRNAAEFLGRLIEAAPCKIQTVLTDNGTHFTHPNEDGWRPVEIRGMLADGGVLLPWLRTGLRSERHRRSPDQTEPPWTNEPSRGDEPDH